ncbi:alcohol dehydrogenase catalytic domain-containing protein [Thermodesulfobacteriota bacterium]
MGAEMQALYVDKGILSIKKNLSVPERAKDEALIRVVVAGICATDLEIVKGYLGFRGVPGHEFVGLVEEADDEQWIGKKVVGSINLGCGHCKVCRGAGPEHCPQRKVLGILGRDGAFAEYLVLPLVNLFEIPEGVSDQEAVFVEPLAAAMRICDQVAIHPSDRIAVVGPGRLGILIAQILGRTGAEVVLLGRRRESIHLAETLDLHCGEVGEIEDNSFDFVVEATGNPGGFAQSLRIVRPRGTLILKSTFAGRSELDLTKVVVAEINIVGSRCGPFAPALRLLATGDIRVKELIEEEYPLSEGRAAFTHAARPGVKKVLLRP